MWIISCAPPHLRKKQGKWEWCSTCLSGRLHLSNRNPQQSQPSSTPQRSLYPTLSFMWPLLLLHTCIRYPSFFWQVTGDEDCHLICAASKPCKILSVVGVTQNGSCWVHALSTFSRQRSTRIGGCEWSHHHPTWWGIWWQLICVRGVNVFDDN